MSSSNNFNNHSGYRDGITPVVLKSSTIKGALPPLTLEIEELEKQLVLMQQEWLQLTMTADKLEELILMLNKKLEHYQFVSNDLYKGE